MLRTTERLRIAHAKVSVLAHTHFHYRMFFNDVSVTETGNVTCNLESQNLTEKKQSITPEIEGNFLAYYGKSHCTTVESCKESLRASDAISSPKGFLYRDVAISSMIPSACTENGACYLDRKELDHIFDMHVLSACQVSNSMDEIVQAMDQVLFGSLRKALDGNFNPSILWEELKMVKTKVTANQLALVDSTRRMKYELDKSEWLYELCQRKLQGFGFVVDTQGKHVKSQWPVNEFSRSKSDLLIYHSEKFERIGSALYVYVGYPADVLCETGTHNIEYNVDMASSTGFVAEVKVEDVTRASENECFYNMCGQASNLALQILMTGKIVTTITMYGIVVATDKPSEARLLKLEIDFKGSCCSFKRANKFEDFSLLLNRVLHLLQC